MKELDWTFEDEEVDINPPLIPGDKIHYSGPLKYYKNGYLNEVSYIDLAYQLISNVKKQDNQWLFQIDGLFRENWIVYQENYTKIL